MKRIIALTLAVLMIAAVFTACGKQESDNKKTEIVVFAAASMTETLEKLAKSYQEDHPDVEIKYNFGSSGTLRTQIEEGAECDLFISAAQKQMNGLEEGGYINKDTRLDLLENKVALCVAENSDVEIKSYEDMKNHLEEGDILMAIGNSDVPVGQYTQKIFAYYNLDEAALADKSVLTYGTDVKDITAKVNEGTVNCGIIYQTDAYSAGLKVTDTATEEMCGKVIYPAAILSESKNADAAKAFLSYLQTSDASKVFEEVGFTPLAS